MNTTRLDRIMSRDSYPRWAAVILMKGPVIEVDNFGLLEEIELLMMAPSAVWNEVSPRARLD